MHLFKLCLSALTISGFLGVSDHLLHVTRIDQILDSVTVPPSVPNPQVSSPMLVSICGSGLLQLLDRPRQHLRLCTGARFLDQGTRSLHRPVRHVVHQRRRQHHHGLGHHHPPDARDPEAAAR